MRSIDRGKNVINAIVISKNDPVKTHVDDVDSELNFFKSRKKPSRNSQQIPPQDTPKQFQYVQTSKLHQIDCAILFRLLIEQTVAVYEQ